MTVIVKSGGPRRPRDSSNHDRPRRSGRADIATVMTCEATPIASWLRIYTSAARTTTARTPMPIGCGGDGPVAEIRWSRSGVGA
jgi:hypothetical protein